MVMENEASEAIAVPHPPPIASQRNSLQRPCEEMLNQEGNVSRGKPRLRKKALHQLILKQMEFYFGDANLAKDRFLGTLIKSDPYVNLNVFLRFNKIRVLTDDVERVAKALKNSKILSLSADGTKVCRTTPINPRDNCDECTIYVQGLPPDANHEWLGNLFSRYGTVAYVSIPRYKSNRKIKGFAFVEFDTVEEANECLNSFREKNCTLPSHTAPQELLSIATFTENEEQLTGDESKTLEKDDRETRIGEKRSASVIEDEDIAKKARIEDGSEGEAGNAEETEDEQISRRQEDENGKKKKRKRKRRGRREETYALDLGLQIMAKKDWKQLRNKYLQLQRNKMKELKQHLRKARWNQWGGGSDRSKDKMEVEQAEEIKEKIETGTETAGVSGSKPKFSFTPGVIVKMHLDEPCSNPKSLKVQLRSDTAVKYIDVQEGSNEAFVRCDNAESAKSFADKYSEDKILTIIDGNEEKAYWDKIAQDRQMKLSKKDRVKHRGRDKLLKKAEKELGKHIKFDEV